MAGLVVLMAPAGGAWTGFVAMAAAGFGWGVYSLAGRGARDALAATAGNFALALVPAAGVALVAGVEFGTVTGRGVALAVVSGRRSAGELMGARIYF